MRRRRKSTATWFPVLPTIYTEGNNPEYPNQTWYDYTTVIPAQDSGSSDITEGFNVGPTATPLTIDFTPEFDQNNQDKYTLADFTQGQDYLLQRVVGKVWCAFTTNDDTRAQRVIACAALAILPVTDNSQGSPSLAYEDYNPLVSDNSQQPWIWRRTWILGGQPFSNGGVGFRGFPQSNAYYGSVADGGHLDSKVKRRVTKEQRLFLVTTVSVIDVLAGPGVDQAADFKWGYDVRVLGSMRRGRNRSTFK